MAYDMPIAPWTSQTPRSRWLRSVGSGASSLSTLTSTLPDEGPREARLDANRDFTELVKLIVEADLKALEDRLAGRNVRS